MRSAARNTLFRWKLWTHDRITTKPPVRRWFLLSLSKVFEQLPKLCFTGNGQTMLDSESVAFG